MFLRSFTYMNLLCHFDVVCMYLLLGMGDSCLSPCNMSWSNFCKIAKQKVTKLRVERSNRGSMITNRFSALLAWTWPEGSLRRIFNFFGEKRTHVKNKCWVFPLANIALKCLYHIWSQFPIKYSSEYVKLLSIGFIFNYTSLGCHDWEC